MVALSFKLIQKLDIINDLDLRHLDSKSGNLGGLTYMKEILKI